MSTVSNIDFDMLYRPQMMHICSIIQYTSLALTTILFIISFYIILKKSTKPMGTYKYLLLNQIIWDYLFDFVLGMWQPILVTRFPIMFAYSYGPLKFLGPHGTIPIFGSLFFIVYGMTHAIYISLLYRVSKVFVGSPLDEIFSNNKKFAFAFFISLLVALAIFNSKFKK